MIGQGRPHPSPDADAPGRVSRYGVLRRLAATVVLLGGMVAGARADEPTLRLRIVWGGGAASLWQGSLTLSEGAFGSPRLLGLEADEPGSMPHTERRLRISQPSPRVYDGLDVPVTAPPDATLTIDLSARGQPDAGRTIAISLAELISGYRNVSLDDRGNRLLVRRAPGDRLRVKLDRPSMVFSPRETFQIEITPHRLGLAAGTSLTLKIELTDKTASKVYWSEEKDLRIGDDGAVGSVGPISVETPGAEGVYDLVATVTEQRLRAPFVTPKPTVRRKVQLVVIDRTLPESVNDAAAEKTVDQLDPANPEKWWARLTRLPQLKDIPGFGKGALKHGRSGAWKHQGRNWMRLDAGAWQAYPLSISDRHSPHVLEVEYPDDVPQTLGISIIEPDATGEPPPIGLGSGVDVVELPSGAEPGIGRHRLIFWPRTKTPLVLLVNRRDAAEAVFGKIRVLRGAPHLAPAGSPESSADERPLLAYFDKPLFPENFSAAESLDPATGRPLDDWNTFYLGGSRLAEYLDHVGYGGAIVPALCEGSTLYPSELLDPTPKYDTGVFFTTGQDPVRKDVLEMLFRLFDRRHLVLVPALQFSTPLPELERLLERGGPDSAGIRWVGPDGRTYLETGGAKHGLAPYYNPLDERVQQAMLRVVGELATRYARHRSFGGVALALAPDGYAQLPGAEWGRDERTLGRFAKDIGIELPDGAAERAELLSGRGRAMWLAWRAARLHALHRRMQAEIAKARSGARLYLAGAEMLDSPAVRRALRPTLPQKGDVETALLEAGIDAAAYRETPDIVLLRPYRVATGTSPAVAALDLQVNDAPKLDRQFAAAGSLFYHNPRTLPLPSFEAAGPLAASKTSAYLISQISPAGFRNRQRFVHSLAMLDAGAMIDGGWLLPMGQEDAVREIFAAYRALPTGTFETVPPDPTALDAVFQPVVVRTLRRERRTYVYLANDSPWPVSVTLRVEAPPECRAESLGDRAIPPLRRNDRGTWWTLSLKPFDLVAGALTAPGAKVYHGGVTLPESVVPRLQEQIRRARARAESLRQPPPLAAPANPGFEPGKGLASIPGWVHAEGRGVTTSLDRNIRHGGNAAVKLDSTGPILWLRSESFEPPKTGRLAVWAYLRVDDPEHQPPLRLAVEGRLAGKTYYRFGQIGAGRDATPLGADWAPYVLQLDDLPMTELQDLRVGFDLMGPGRVWVDDVRLYDLSFTPDERDELSKIIALADFHLRRRKVGDCARVLSSYWPRFLAEHVPLDATRLVGSPDGSGRPAVPPAPRKPEPPSLLDRAKAFLPRRLWF